MLFFSAYTSAECKIDDGSFHTVSIILGTITVPTDTPVGSTVFTQDYLFDSVAGHQSFSCGGRDWTGNYITTMSGSAISPNIYNTGISGLGIRISMYSEADYWAFPVTATPAPFTVPLHVTGADNASFGSAYLHVVVDVIKTGESLTAGNLDYVAPEFAYADTLKLADLQVSGVVTVSSCTVDSSTPKIVELDTVSSSKLATTGSTANSKPFDITLNCNGSSNVNVTLSGEEDVNTHGLGVLALDSSSTAKGVGIQILYQDNPVMLNQLMSVGTATTGQFKIPFTARYYKTLSTVTAGDVSAVATYTLTYL